MSLKKYRGDVVVILHRTKPARTASVNNQSAAIEESEGEASEKKWENKERKQEASILVDYFQNLTHLPLFSLRHDREILSTIYRLPASSCSACRTPPIHQKINKYADNPSDRLPVFPVSCARRRSISVKLDAWQLRALLHICLTPSAPRPDAESLDTLMHVRLLWY